MASNDAIINSDGPGEHVVVIVKKIELKWSSSISSIAEAEVDPSAKSMSIFILDLYDFYMEHSFRANQVWTTWDGSLLLCLFRIWYLLNHLECMSVC